MRNLKKTLLIVACGFLIASVSNAQDVGKKPVKKSNASQITKTDIDKQNSEASHALRIMPAGGGVSDEWSVPSGELKFFSLPYEYSALEPSIDKQTVEVHYDKHHRGYFTNFQNAIAETELSKLPIYKIFGGISLYSPAVRNNAGGYFNHVLYWQNINPKGEREPSEFMMSKIAEEFGNYGDFIKKFSEVSKSIFGSGWAWLSVDYKSGQLFISTTPNQDNPMMGTAERMGVPILALDVWEHAYYLKYQNRRADYIEAFWKIIDWGVVEKRYKEAISKMPEKVRK